MDEAQTRQDLIDTALRLAGWDVGDPTQVSQELPIPTGEAGGAVVGREKRDPYEGFRFADYALVHHGKPAAVVEAKRTSKDAELGQEQALQYAQQLQRNHGGELPFVFYSNGHEHHFWEHDVYPPARVHGFPTRDDLEWMAERREHRRPLTTELIDTAIAGRDYQIAAIRTILAAIEAKRRKLLLVMATGTGKTRTAAALVDVLTRARWAKRVLFLVDRVALQEQALDAFKEHLPSTLRWPAKEGEPFSRVRRLYVSTYPTMLNLIHAGTTPATWISPFFFDVVIADESHRSVYDAYKTVLDYFHAIKLGLTATPRQHVAKDTFELFECEAGDPTFAYAYEEAVAHDPPYLCPFEVLKVRSRFQLEGIKGPTLSTSEQQKLFADGVDPADVDFEGSDLERKVTNAGTNVLLVRQFMEECIADPAGTLPGKTIVFALTRKHAWRLQEIFDRLYPQHAGELARVIVGGDSRAHGRGGLIDQFRRNDMPRVAISVDMLDTGVDIREVVNLVFAKPVYSYVKFWQMIGRGTRVLEDDPAKRKPWCPTKDRFRILDCWGNFDYFKMNPEGVEPAREVPAPVRLFTKRLDLLEGALAAGRADVVAATSAELQADLAALPARDVRVADRAADLAQARAAEFWTTITPEGLGFLRSVIAPVLRARADADWKTLRFECDAVDYRRAALASDDDSAAAIRGMLVSQVAELPLAVNRVKREADTVAAVQDPAWWAAATDEAVRAATAKLAPLMPLRERPRDDIMALDLQDALAVKERIEVGPGIPSLAIGAYRARAEQYLRTVLASNPVLRQVVAGEPVADADLRRLADQLGDGDPPVTEDRLRKAYDQRRADLYRLLRHALGAEILEPRSAAVTRAFDDFIASHTDLSPSQIRFLQVLRNVVLAKGTVDRADLVAPPFTQVAEGGFPRLFTGTLRDAVLALLDRAVA